MNYRAEIDGLRAIAVVSVILFHAKYSVFPGGFLGVDIFFVISGYLITALLLKDLQRDSFSLKSFYERRARRILPAFFVVLLCSFIAALFLMTPETAKGFYQSAIAAVLSLSNIFFVHDSDYFSTDVDMKPLLHTWSLGLEEQFYIFFPIGLFIIWKYCRRYLAIIMGLGFLLSLMAAEFMLYKGYITANFYLLPSRGWELLAGSLVAYRETRGAIKANDRVASAAALLGLLIILGSLVLFHEKVPHPGLLTLFPVIGTCLVIYYGRVDGIAKSILSHRTMVMVGLISYSLYLWHNPIFSFARFYAIDPLTPVEYAGLIFASFFMGYLSYRYVEVPTRNRRQISERQIWIGSATGAVVLLSACGVLLMGKGFPQRFAPEFAPVLHGEVSRSETHLLIGGVPCNQRSPSEECIIGNDKLTPSWAIVGDSHAGTTGVSFDREFKRRNEAALFLVQNGCAYLVGAQFDANRRKRCGPYTEYVQKKLQDAEIKNVVIINRYSNSPLDPERMRVYAQLAEDLLKAGKTVYLVHPVPQSDWNVPNQMFKLLVRGMDPNVTSDHDAYLNKLKPLFDAYESLAAYKNLHRIYPDKILCDGHRCLTEKDDKVLYFDDNHLSIEGADLIVQEILKP